MPVGRGSVGKPRRKRSKTAARRASYGALRKRRLEEAATETNTKRRLHELSVNRVGTELANLTMSNRYHTITTPFLRVLLRLSTVPRRGTGGVLDYDIVQIEAQPAGAGIGYRFFKTMVEAARARGRGVFLEQCISEGSQGLRTKLLRDGLATPYGDMSALSVYDGG